MESDRQLDPEERPRPLPSDLGQGLGSLLPPDADDGEAGGSSPAPHPNQPEPVAATRASAAIGPLPASTLADQTRDLNDVVHRILIVGLLVSTVLLLFGLIPDLLRGQALPAAVLPPAEALRRAVALDPAGFLSLGLLVLIFTPVVRVIGSIVVFISERDWLYCGVTLFVLMVMVVSVILVRV